VQRHAVVPSHAAVIPAFEQDNPAQHGLVGEQACPSCSQLMVLGAQEPATWPCAIEQAKPAQQSPLVVQLPPCGWQVAGAWQVPDVQIPEQHAAAVVHIAPLAEQGGGIIPPSAPPPLGIMSVVHAYMFAAGVRRQVVPGQQVLLPGVQLSPATPQATGLVQSRVPPMFGTHSRSPQHWSLNWHVDPSAMQHAGLLEL
jgi:hypothetical protein